MMGKIVSTQRWVSQRTQVRSVTHIQDGLFLVADESVRHDGGARSISQTHENHDPYLLTYA
jgi:hypothetical protein